MLVKNSKWKGMSVIQKKELILRLYVKNLELHFIRSGFDKSVEFRLKEAQFILRLLKERIA